MDSHPQPNPQPGSPAERVEITDYPGVASSPQITTPPLQREIKQFEDDTPAPPIGGQRSPIGWLDRRIPHFAFAVEDGKLVLTRSKLWSLPGRCNMIALALFATFFLYQEMGQDAGSLYESANLTQIITSLFSHPSSELAFHATIMAIFLILGFSQTVAVVKFLRSKGDQLIFDRETDSFSRSRYPNTKTPLNMVREVNADQQSNQYRVALLQVGGSKTPIDTWYNEAEAVYAAAIISEYLGVPLTRTESPATVTQGCVVTIGVFILILISILIALWIGGAIFHQ